MAQSCYVGTINNPQPILWTDPYYKNPFSREEKNQTGPWSVWARRWLQTRIEGFTWCHFNLHFLFLVCFVHQRRRLFKAPSAFSTRPSQTLSIWLLLKCKQITSASINPAAEGGREGGLQPCREQQTDRKMKCIKESIMLFFFFLNADVSLFRIHKNVEKVEETFMNHSWAMTCLLLCVACCVLLSHDQIMI